MCWGRKWSHFGTRSDVTLPRTGPRTPAHARYATALTFVIKDEEVPVACSVDHRRVAVTTCALYISSWVNTYLISLCSFLIVCEPHFFQFFFPFHFFFCTQLVEPRLSCCMSAGPTLAALSCKPERGMLKPKRSSPFHCAYGMDTYLHFAMKNNNGCWIHLVEIYQTKIMLSLKRR